MKKDLSFTESFSKSSKFFLYLCAGIGLCCDIAVVVMLAVSGLPSSEYVYPVMFLIADGLFVFTALFTNFRFKYSVCNIVLYLAATVLFCIITLVNDGTNDFIIFSSSALWCRLALHAGVTVACLISYLYSARLMKGRRRTGLLITCIASVICAVLGFSYFSLTVFDGYLGQDEHIDRGLIYRESGEGLEVCDVLAGRGDRVVIPYTFNGREVERVSCKIFDYDDIDTVVFNCSEDVEFTDTDALNSDRKIKVYAAKENIDGIKSKLYSLKMYSLANSVKPEWVEDDEVYVTFSYGSGDYKAADGQIINTWFGKKGEKISLDELGCDYARHADITSDEDLYWNLVNNGGYIMKKLSANGKPLEGATVSSPLNVNVEFTKVKTIEIADDNDDKYEPAASFKQTRLTDKILNYRLATADSAQKILDGLPARNGFTYVWEYKSGDFWAGLANSSISGYLGSRDSITVRPRWKLNEPKVTFLSDGNLPVYGDAVSFTATCVAPVSGVAVSYSMMRGNVRLTDTLEYTERVMPYGDFTYSFTAVAGDDNITSLTSEKTVTLSFSVGKRPLTVVWRDPENLEYNAAVKSVGLSIDGNVVPADEGKVGLAENTKTVKNAGTYNLTATLSGQEKDKYYLTNGSHSVTVSRAPLEIVWDNARKIYNGYPQTPDLHIAQEGFFADDYNYVSALADAFTNAGTYTCNASLIPRDNTTIKDNYYIASGAENPFTIDKAAVAVNWNTATEFVYNREEQYPAASATGYLNEQVVSSVKGNVNAGENLTATASTANGNYTLTNAVSHTYTIKPREITVRWTAEGLLEHTYTAAIWYPTATGYNGAVAADLSALMAATSHTGDITAVDCGGYTVSAVLDPASDIAKNYTVTGGIQKQFQINPAELEVKWGTLALVYNGEEQRPAATAKGLGGDGYVNLTVSGGGTDVGAYTATAAISDSVHGGNYYIKTPDTRFTIEKLKVAAVWSDTTLTYNGREQKPAATAAGVNGYVIETSVFVRTSSDTWTSKGAVTAGSYAAQAYIGQEDGRNYLLTNETTQFVINKFEARVIWSDTILTYNGGEQKPSACFVGVVPDQYTVLKVDGGKVDAGNYTAVATFTVPQLGDNYILHDDQSTFVIQKAKLKITVGNATVELGEDIPQTGYKVEGLVAGQSEEEVIDVTLKAAEYTASGSAGQYELTAEYTLTNVNYEVETVAGILTVTQTEEGGDGQ